ncbi:MAG: hypothetical protein Alpg2KO_12410 [Alphaproteobacteria bacterium]
MKLALFEMINDMDVQANQSAILQAAAQAAQSGAKLLITPECALSGFSARLSFTTQDDLQCALAPLQDAAERDNIALLVGTQLPPDQPDEGPQNGFAFISPGRPITYAAKTGLTDSERRFFAAPEGPGARVLALGEYRLGLLICAEVEDPPAPCLDPSLNALIWPGYWRWEDQEGWQANRHDGSPNHAWHLQRKLSRPLIQANFAANAEADPRVSGPNGRSVCISADGRPVHQTITIQSGKSSLHIVSLDSLQ